MGYVLLLLAGALICNALPHLAAGLRGEPFPTPFVRPRGVAPSPPLLNFLWGTANLFAGVIAADKLLPSVHHGLAVMMLGFVALGVPLSWHFAKVRRGTIA